MTTSETPVIRVSAVVLRNAAGQLLTVRKAGTSRFMLPGGKPEAGESAAQTALRECTEELGVRLDPVLLRPLGVFLAAAANEDDHQVEAAVFAHPSTDPVAPSAEIAELRWLDVSEPGRLPNDLAPLLTDRVLPALGVVPPVRRPCGR